MRRGQLFMTAAAVAAAVPAIGSAAAGDNGATYTGGQCVKFGWTSSAANPHLGLMPGAVVNTPSGQITAGPATGPLCGPLPPPS